MTKSIFLDANILVSASSDYAPFSEASRLAVDKAHASTGATIWISRQVLREVAATLSRQQSWTAPADPEALAIQLARLLKLYRVAEENAQSTEHLLRFIRDGRARGRQVHDANIVAVMLANGIKKLVTINAADFKRFEGEIEVAGVA